MNIVFAASEGVPFSKTGGLADVVGALPRALAALGHQVSVYLPRYRQTKLSEPATVVRSGTAREIPLAELVSGDIVKLAAGRLTAAAAVFDFPDGLFQWANGVLVGTMTNPGSITLAPGSRQFLYYATLTNSATPFTVPAAVNRAEAARSPLT